MSVVREGSAPPLVSISGTERPADPKLHPPRTRRRLVPRARLLEELTAARGPLVSVVAPAGYGKSTLLAQWAQSDPRPFAWVTLDDLDNDPATLLGWLAAAVQQLPGAGPYPRGRLTVRRVATMLATVDPPPVIVLDDAHLVRDLSALDTLTDLLPYLAEGAVLAFGGRAQPVSLPRLRVELDPLELGPDDLALDDDETYSALAAAGVTIDRSGAHRVRARTEGWAAVVTLAATAARRGVDLTAATSGDQRAVAEYLHSEVMARLNPPDVEFLRRSAVLVQPTGPSCDAVLERTGSAATLESLAADHQLVLPVDTGRERYRYHPVLRDLLLGELAREDAREVQRLRRRAADWYADHGDPWGALQYRYDAGDLDDAAHLVASYARAAWARGHAATVEHWILRLERDGVVDRHPELAALWAVLHTLEGNDADADRWATLALAQDADCASAKGAPSLPVLQTLLAALRCEGGVAQMRADAARLVDLLPPSQPWVATGIALDGIADVLDGDVERASHRLAHALDVARRLDATGAEVGAVGVFALLLAERHRWDDARSLVRDGLRTISQKGLDDYGLAGIVHAAAVRVFDHDGDDASRLVATARFDALRPRMTHAMPYLSVMGRLAVAAVHRGHGEWEAARTLVVEMQAILDRRPGLGRLPDDVATLAATLGERRGGRPSGSILTVAELRLLPLLPTHLSFRGIGERLFLSQHTIKSQALSIYRKLDVTSRDQAVTRARELGLLDD